MLPGAGSIQRCVARDTREGRESRAEREAPAVVIACVALTLFGTSQITVNSRIGTGTTFSGRDSKFAALLDHKCPVTETPRQAIVALHPYAGECRVLGYFPPADRLRS